VVALAGCERFLGETAVSASDGALQNHDEDNDGVPDATDNCPTVANAGFNGVQADGDGDLVGDACDPHPMTPGDSIVDVAYFTGNFGNWTPDVDGWTLGEDWIDSPPGTASSTRLEHAQITARHATIEVHFEVSALATTYSIGTHLDLANDGTYCEVTPDVLWAWVNGGANGGYLNGLDTTAHYVARHSLDVPTMTCTLGPTVATQNNSDGDDTLLKPAIEVDQLQARIESIVIYAYSGP